MNRRIDVVKWKMHGDRRVACIERIPIRCGLEAMSSSVNGARLDCLAEEWHRRRHPERAKAKMWVAGYNCTLADGAAGAVSQPNSSGECFTEETRVASNGTQGFRSPRKPRPVLACL